MRRQNNRGVRWLAVVARGAVLVGAAAVAVEVIPELAPVRRYAREAPEFAAHLPTHARQLLETARAHFEQARTAFQVARTEGERALTAQFEEAKQRGSVPPL